MKISIMMITPYGVVPHTYTRKANLVSSVKLTNIASYLAAENIKVSCSGTGELTADVAYGGNFYAIIDPQENFTGIQDYTADQIISWSREIRDRINQQQTFVHPMVTTFHWLTNILRAVTLSDSN